MTEEEKKPVLQYRSYGKRWLVLLVVAMLNLAGAMIWLTFVAVAYRAIVYYNTTLDVINWLSLVFNLSGILMGAVATYVLERFGLKFALVLSAWLTCIGACIRIVSTIESLSNTWQLVFVFIGQTMAAIGQPFSMYAPAKTASIWFPDDQRALATTIGAISNPIGVVIAGLTAPFFVDPTSGDLDAMNLLITMAAPAAFSAVLATFVMTSKAPPTPPSAGATEKGGYFGSGLKKVIKNKNYVILLFAVGGALGLYSTFATLLEQILCPFGYTDTMAGISAAVMTGAGVIGAAILGVVVDRTKQFSTIIKSCYAITAVGLVVFCCIFHIYMGYLILIMVGFIGLFSFGIYPIGVELGVESTYPVGVATSSGLIMISGQIQSIVLVLILQVIGREMSVDETNKYGSKCHLSSDPVPSTTAPPFLFDGGTESPPLPTYDLSVSVYVCGGYFVLLMLLLVLFFRPKYNRMAMELEKSSSPDRFSLEKRSNEMEYTVDHSESKSKPTYISTL